MSGHDIRITRRARHAAKVPFSDMEDWAATRKTLYVPYATPFPIRPGVNWDNRERERESSGANILSYGTVEDSDRTGGESAVVDPKKC